MTTATRPAAHPGGHPAPGGHPGGHPGGITGVGAVRAEGYVYDRAPMLVYWRPPSPAAWPAATAVPPPRRSATRGSSRPTRATRCWTR